MLIALSSIQRPRIASIIAISILAICMPFASSAYRSVTRNISTSKISPNRIQPIIPRFIPPFASFFTSSPRSSDNMSSQPPKVQKSEEEWQAVLSPEQFRVLRKKGTEMAGAHPYDRKTSADEGVYHCAACDAPLFTSKTKFKSGCGWPAFFDTIPGAVNRHEDRSMFMSRVEITCANCGGHLGHVFKGEGFSTPTDERHCVNGVSLNFKST